MIERRWPSSMAADNRASGVWPLDDPAVICPVQQGLALAWATVEVAPLAVRARSGAHADASPSNGRSAAHHPPCAARANSGNTTRTSRGGRPNVLPALGAPD